MLDSKQGQLALEALWALHACGGFNDTVAPQLLRHTDPFVRAWTLRLLTDDHIVSASLAQQFAEMAANETNVEVRCQLASSARRLPAQPTHRTRRLRRSR